MDLPPELSTLTALTTLRLDLDHLVNFDELVSDEEAEEEEEQNLLLSAPGLQYLSLVENRQSQEDSGFRRGHNLAQLTGVLQNEVRTVFGLVPNAIRVYQI